VELRGLEPLAFWMQTSGTALLAVERCSLVRVWMAAQDSRSAHGLLYFAAVQDDWCEQNTVKVALTPGRAPRRAGLSRILSGAVTYVLA
jgi:hypothetical protein